MKKNRFNFKIYFSIIFIIIVFIVGCINNSNNTLDKNSDYLDIYVSDVYRDAEAIVTIISDDGNWETAKNLNIIFGKYDLKCTSAGVVEIVDPYLDSWKTLLKKGTIDLVNHSYSHIRMDDGNIIATDYDALTHEIVDSDKWFEETFGYEQIVFVCPENQMCQMGYEILNYNNFYAVRRGDRGFNTLSPIDGIESGNWFNLKVQGICDDGVDISVRNDWVNTAINDKVWLIEMWHNVMPEYDGLYQTILLSDAEEHIAYISEKSQDNKIWVATFDEAVKYIREKQNISIYAYIENNELHVFSDLNDDKMSYTTFNQPLTIHIYEPKNVDYESNNYSVFNNGEIVLDIIPGEKYTIQLTGDEFNE